MKDINWDIVLSNIAEARHELESMESIIKKKTFSEGELQVGLQHAYHHLNFAWNVRHVSTRRYAHLSDAEFRKWGKYPREIDKL